MAETSAAAGAAATTTGTVQLSASTDKRAHGVVAGKRNVLITSALPYVNNVPHLGNLIGAVVSADVFARYCRLRGYNVLFVCGTDEYGTATETKALKDGVSCRELCDKYNALHREVYTWFGCAFDAFGRTTTAEQTDVAQRVFRSLDANGYVLEKESEQLHCDRCARFLADRYVLGTCPSAECGATDARGDQCDKCGKLWEPTELIEPRCSVCAARPQQRATRHLYLDLPKAEPRLAMWLRSTAERCAWTPGCLAISETWLKAGLQPRAITRDLKWGSPVPRDGYENKVFYVWYDAPLGYISITKRYTDDWQQWWRPERADDVEYHLFMGKDNVPFHTIIFPSCLLATDDNWKLPDYYSTTEYLNYEGQKFSKSNEIGVFGLDAKQSKLAPEVWRYYLLATRPESNDAQFMWDDLAARTNNELLANLGNFINRHLKFVVANFDSKVPALAARDAELEKTSRAVADAAAAEQNNKDSEKQADDKGADKDTAAADDKNKSVGQRRVELIRAVDVKLGEYIALLERHQLREGLAKVMEISSLGNGFVQATSPWTLVKNDKASDAYGDACTVVNTAVNLSLLLAAIALPFVPSLSEKVLSQLRFDESRCSIAERWDANVLAGGHELGTVEPLVRKIDAKEIAAFKAKFGCQADMIARQFPLDLRAGVVRSAKAHPDSDTLWLLEVDAGDTADVIAAQQRVDVLRASTPADATKLAAADAAIADAEKRGGPFLRPIVAGLRKQYPDADALVGRSVLLLCNLPVATIKDARSFGMLLTVEKPKTKPPQLDAVELSPNCTPGAVLLPRGCTAAIKPNLDKKEFTKLNLKTNADGHIVFKMPSGDVPLLVDGKDEKTFAGVKGTVGGKVK